MAENDLLGHTPELSDGPLRRAQRLNPGINGRVRPTAASTAKPPIAPIRVALWLQKAGRLTTQSSSARKRQRQPSRDMNWRRAGVTLKVKQLAAPT